MAYSWVGVRSILAMGISSAEVGGENGWPAGPSGGNEGSLRCSIGTGQASSVCAEVDCRGGEGCGDDWCSGKALYGFIFPSAG